MFLWICQHCVETELSKSHTLILCCLCCCRQQLRLQPADWIWHPELAARVEDNSGGCQERDWWSTARQNQGKTSTYYQVYVFIKSSQCHMCEVVLSCPLCGLITHWRHYISRAWVFWLAQIILILSFYFYHWWVRYVDKIWSLHRFFTLKIGRILHSCVRLLTLAWGGNPEVKHKIIMCIIIRRNTEVWF